MKPDRRDTHRLRNLIAILSILFGFCSASVWLINRPAVLRHVLAVVNVRSDWLISIDSLSVHPSSSSIKISNINIRHKEKQKDFSAKNVRIEISPLGLLRGKIVMDDLQIDQATMSLPKSVNGKLKRPKSINLTKLILIKSLTIDDGRINQLLLRFGENTSLTTDEVRLNLKSGILGRTVVDIRTDGLAISKNDKLTFSSGMLHIHASSIISKWHEDFPYLNMLDGSLKLSDSSIEGLKVEGLDAKLSLVNNDLKLKKLDVTVDGRHLSGTASANFATEDFSLLIDIAKPISLPYIVRPIKTIHTGGALSGSIKLEGHGFIPSRSSGSADIDIKHRFDVAPEFPMALHSKPTWKNGVITLKNSFVSVNADRVLLSGTADIPGKKFDIRGNAEKFPIEYVFDKFQNPHLKKISGKSDVEASFAGWGKKFKADIKGESYQARWNDITADRVITKLLITYDDLNLDGIILSGMKKTGEAKLHLHFGPKIKDFDRKKDISLTAYLKKHPLERSFEAYGLTGTGDGDIELHGTVEKYEGLAHTDIKAGSFKGVEFEKVHTDIHISKRKVVFKDIDISLFKAKPETPGEITADVFENRTHFHGSPSPELNIDATYFSDAKKWNLKKISWASMTNHDNKLNIEGTIANAGPLDLKINGNTDISFIKPFVRHVRNGSGPVSLAVSIKGTGENPLLYGNIDFNKNDLVVRGFQLVLENLEGNLRLKGSRIIFDNLTAKSEDGSLRLSGWLDHKHKVPHSSDIRLVGDAMRYRSSDGSFNVEFEGDLRLKGNYPSPLLSGNILILDGKYTKDFKIIDVIFEDESDDLEGPGTGKDKANIDIFNPRLSLNIKNNGDMEIDNNVGRIWLRVNVDVKGTRAKPSVAGSVNTEDGEIHYLGLQFDINKGFIEFREKYAEPYMEVHAEREVGVYNINLTLHGSIDNLSLDLSATSPSGPLEKRDVVSLILFGTTEQERELAAQHSGTDYTSSLVAKSVSGVMERPVTRFTRLDVFRLEAADPGSSSLSRLYVGKEISDRLSVNFATDIDTNDSIQTIIAEYLLTDQLLIRGSRSTDFSSEISGLLRFKMR